MIFGTVPSKSNNYVHGNGRVYKSKAVKDYEDAFILQCDKYRNAMIDGPFELNMTVYYPSRRADLDGSFKVILDCLQKVRAITNDRNCVKINAERAIDKDNPHIRFNLTEL